MNRFAYLIAIGLLAVASVADAAQRRPHPSEVNWAQVPTGADHQAAEAGVKRAPGRLLRAVARCEVMDTGELAACRLVSESPPGSGLGEALLSMTPKYRRKPPGKDDLRQVNIVDVVYEADVHADWRKRPSPDDLIAVWPTEAYRRGQGGEAVLNCVVTVQGALKDCVTLEESPLGAGFAAAAIALTPQFLMRPATKDGAPVESIVNLPINFRTYGAGSTADSKKVLQANVAWTEAPSFSDVAAAYPQRAREERKGGRATLSCHMSSEGRLTKCSTATSSPAGYGFDKAARALSRQFAYAVTSDADRKAARNLVVHLPVTFDPSMLDASTQVVGKPTWAAIPTAEQLRAAFAKLNVTSAARAALNCVVQPGGGLWDCSIVSEEPADVGVGAAVLALTPSFRLSTWTSEGLPVVGGRVTIPLRYEPAAPEAPVPE